MDQLRRDREKFIEHAKKLQIHGKALATRKLRELIGHLAADFNLLINELESTPNWIAQTGGQTTLKLP